MLAGMVRGGLALMVVCACGSPRLTPVAEQPARAGDSGVAASETAGGRVVLRGAEVIGHGVVDLEIFGGEISRIGDVDPRAPVLDVRGKFIAPAFIDSHVHLAYFPAGEELLAGGVAAVVDLAAPLAWLDAPAVPAALRVIASGPMITARRGYPTRGWGAGGYGREVGGPREAEAAVDELHAHGAAIIKLPVTGAPVLGEDALRAAVVRAHGHGLKVVSHALLDGEVRVAAAVGVDALAHAPVEPLTDPGAWSGRAVISTLTAFGGATTTIENLRVLRAAGAIVLYGTDLGNTRDAGISGDEIDLLRAAGLDGAAILEAGTHAPAAYWGLLDAEGRGPGVIAVGGPASFLVLKDDPRRVPETLADPEAVYVAGVRRSGAR
jgi:imidazolonepropionase-like amidohydrolase